jgi:hypothetical protein
MTLRAQKLKMRCAYISDAANVCAKLKAMSKLIAIDLCYARSLPMLVGLGQMMVFQGEDDDQLTGFKKGVSRISSVTTSKDVYHGVG